MLIATSLITGVLRTLAVMKVMTAPKPQGPGTHPSPNSGNGGIGVAQNVQVVPPQVPIVPAVEMVAAPGQPVVLQATPMQAAPGVLVHAPPHPEQNAKLL